MIAGRHADDSLAALDVTKFADCMNRTADLEAADALLILEFQVNRAVRVLCKRRGRNQSRVLTVIWNDFAGGLNVGEFD